MIILAIDVSTITEVITMELILDAVIFIGCVTVYMGLIYIGMKK